MNKLHAKSPCCKAKVYHFGQRRRQCSVCKKTWRIRVKKRGRKTIRIHPDIKLTVIRRKESLRHKAERLGKNRERIRRKHARNLEMLLKRLPKPEPPSGELIVIIDGWALYFKKKRHILYMVLLRPINSNQAVVMEPILLPGHEKKGSWEYVLKKLPLSVRKRIKAIVLDGITGVECLAQNWGWVVQRCHFHQISMLQTLRGRRWSTVKNKELREQIYQNVIQILNVESESKSGTLIEETKFLLKEPECPKWLKLRVGGFLRRVDFFRSYRRYPQLNLPSTTNSAECVNQMITETMRLARGFSTPESFEKWIKVQIRAMKPIKCNGKIFNQYFVS